MTTAYPLAWPPGWPRTQRREKGPYRTELTTAINNLRRELALLAGQKAAASLVLSSNASLGQDNPPDPGVVAYFVHGERQVAIPCDRWAKLAHNVQAIALNIEALRAIERHGAKHMVTAMFQGFVALPAPDSKAWWQVLGLAGPILKPNTIDVTRRALARLYHPDGGAEPDAARMAAINAAADEGLRLCEQGTGR